MKQHSPLFLNLVLDAKKHIKEITPLVLKEKIERAEPMCIIDVREDNEWQTVGHIPTALHLGKGIIERDIENLLTDLKTPIIVYCSGGFRSALAAKSLQQMGFNRVYSLSDGLKGWIDAGFSIEKD